MAGTAIAPCPRRGGKPALGAFVGGPAYARRAGSVTASANTGGTTQAEARRRYEMDNPLALPGMMGAGGLGLALGAGVPAAVGEAVRAAGGEGDAASAAGLLVLDVAATALCFFLLQRSVAKRSSDIDVIAKELELSAFSVRVPKGVAEKDVRLGQFAGVRRVFVLYGPEAALVADLERADVYRQHLIASRILVVPVSSNMDGRPDALARAVAARRRWCAMPTSQRAFAAWLAPVTQGAEHAYLTVGTNGRVRGSGIGRPRFDSLLATFPRNLVNAFDADEPVPVMDADESSAAPGSTDERTRAGLESASRAFYDALLAGDEAAMEACWSGAPDSIYLSGAVAKGARRDPWSTVLREDRRPVGLATSDLDATLAPSGRGFVTLVETVKNGSTLLATQTFERASDTDAWRIVEHRTIPYGTDIVAKVCLRCDHRGCVALPVKAAASFKAGADVPADDEVAAMLARD